jgi:hypothetical protein
MLQISGFYLLVWPDNQSIDVPALLGIENCEVFLPASPSQAELKPCQPESFGPTCSIMTMIYSA